MYATIRENSGKMEGGLVGFEIFDSPLPSAGLPDLSSGKSLVDFSDTLLNNLTTTESVMTNFGIPHLTSQNAHRLTGSLES